MCVLRFAAAAAVGALAWQASKPAGTTSAAAVTTAAVSEAVDPLINEALTRDRIPGAGFVFVQNGRVVYARSYGVAAIEPRRTATTDSTIWRVGSISKVFTATAVMQLVDKGKIDLDAPVGRYVRRVSIPDTFPEPVTVRHLLNHSAGFDEINPGRQAAARDGVLSLSDFLQGKLIRLRPPGRTIAYSTYGITLAGELVEEVSGLPFETYLRQNIWEPLGMSRTSIAVPAKRQGDVAIGYELKGQDLVPQSWEWYHTTPASSVNATIPDMAKFLIAHLEAGEGRARPLLSERAAREMQRQQITMHPSMPGFALGFYEDYVGLQRVLEHGGNMAGFSALMTLVPEARSGFFIVHHSESNKLRDTVKFALMDKFFPRARERRPVPALPPADSVRVEQFLGRYAPLWSCFSCRPIRVPSLLPVTANEDGTLTFAGGRWIAVDDLRFVNEKGSGYIVFRRDGDGAIREVFAGGFWGWQKMPGQ